eukprot:SAG31_NODE_5559_length_2458_cov_3.930479_2_plen_91_part_00
MSSSCIGYMNSRHSTHTSLRAASEHMGMPPSDLNMKLNSVMTELLQGCTRVPWNSFSNLAGAAQHKKFASSTQTDVTHVAGAECTAKLGK